MARRRSDIPQGRESTPDMLYWAPDAPGFLERRETSRTPASSTMLPYEQARQKAREASAQREAEARSRRSGATSMIDFGSLEAARSFESREYGVGDYFDAGQPKKRRPYLWDEDYDPASDYARLGDFSAPATSPTALRMTRERAAELPRETRREPLPSRTGGTPRQMDAFAAEPAQRSAGRYRNAGRYPEEAPSRNRYRQATAGERFQASRQGQEPEQEWEQEQEPPRNLVQKLRRDYRQWKADRRFNRDYADAPAAGEGPRAALYKGEMGRTHQRAARMQDAATGARGGAAGTYAHTGIFSRFVLNRHFAVLATVAFCLVMSFNLIYPEAQDYYLKVRQADQAQAEYQAVLQRNQQLENHVAALQTDEGMEELAHESLGWVREGENSVSVIGDGSSDPTTDAEGRSGAVVAGSIPAPVTWYSPVLDAVFGYEG